MNIPTTTRIRKVLYVSEEMSRQISRYWHGREIASETEAIRRLISAGLYAEAAATQARRPLRKPRT